MRKEPGALGAFTLRAKLTALRVKENSALWSLLAVE